MAWHLAPPSHPALAAPRRPQVHVSQTERRPAQPPARWRSADHPRASERSKRKAKQSSRAQTIRDARSQRTPSQRRVQPELIMKWSMKRSMKWSMKWSRKGSKRIEIEGQEPHQALDVTPKWNGLGLLRKRLRNQLLSARHPRRRPRGSTSRPAPPQRLLGRSLSPWLA